jgi:hypothetical protein
MEDLTICASSLFRTFDDSDSFGSVEYSARNYAYYRHFDVVSCLQVPSYIISMELGHELGGRRRFLKSSALVCFEPKSICDKKPFFIEGALRSARWFRRQGELR